MPFWNDFSSKININERIYDEYGSYDTGTLIAEITLCPNEEKTVKLYRHRMFLIIIIIGKNVKMMMELIKNGKITMPQCLKTLQKRQSILFKIGRIYTIVH